MQWGQAGNGPGQFTNPGGIAVGADGSIYVGDTFTDRIQEFDRNGRLILQWGSNGTADGQLAWPGGLAVAGAFVYVTDTGNHRVQKFDMAGRFVAKVGQPAGEDNRFFWPYDVAVGPDGSFYIADSYFSRIQHFDLRAGFVANIQRGTGDEQELSGPIGVTVAPNGSIFVADTYQHRVQVFDADGQFTRRWGQKGTGGGEFDTPMGIALGPDGTVYVADTGNNRIEKFATDGQYIAQWGHRGNGRGEFDNPRGVAVAADGTLYVADIGNNRIQKFAADGQFIAQWGRLGHEAGEFNAPMDVAVDVDGAVYVADQHNHRVQKFSGDGQLIAILGTPGTAPGQFFAPVAVAVGRDGDVYVAELGIWRVQRLVLAAASVFLPVAASTGAPDETALVTGRPTPVDDLIIRTDTLFEPGVYVVDDIADNGALIIGADGVTLDCNHATLLGKEGRGFGVYNPGHHNVTIRNCRIHNYYYAIRADAGDNLQILDNDLSGNRVMLDDRLWNYLGQTPQIDYDSNLGGGIFLYHSTGSVIARNVLTNQQNGLDLYASSQTRIVSNQISDNRGWGVHLDGSSHNLIADNTMERVDRSCVWSWVDQRCGWGGLDVIAGCGCDTAALLITRGSNDNVVTGNNLRYSGDGLLAGPTTGWACSDRNLIAYNDGSYSPHNAFEFTFCADNTFVGNTADYSEYGFWLGYSDGISLTGNQIIGNRVGVAIEHGRDNTLSDNLVANNTDLGISLWTDYDKLFLELFPDTQDSRGYTIQGNILGGNRAALELQGTTDSRIERNRFLDNLTGIRLTAATVQSDTISSVANILEYNDLDCTTAGQTCVYHLNNSQSADVLAGNNWWGTTVTATIEARIRDRHDDPILGAVEYVPFLAEPVGGQIVAAGITGFSPTWVADAGPVDLRGERWNAQWRFRRGTGAR
jgi:parallel beta-helix repeat protein